MCCRCPPACVLKAHTSSPYVFVFARFIRLLAAMRTRRFKVHVHSVEDRFIRHSLGTWLSCARQFDTCFRVLSLLATLQKNSYWAFMTILFCYVTLSYTTWYKRYSWMTVTQFRLSMHLQQLIFVVIFLLNDCQDINALTDSCPKRTSHVPTHTTRSRLSLGVPGTKSKECYSTCL